MANYTDLNYNDTASSVSTNEANLNSQQKPNATDEVGVSQKILKHVFVTIF